MPSELESMFQTLCEEHGRPGLLAAVPLSMVRFMPEQEQYLRKRLAFLDADWKDITAICLGLAYHGREVKAIPSTWKTEGIDRWNEYARAYTSLNRSLNDISKALAARYGGISEGATLEGFASQVSHVREYFPLCASHRAVAEAAGLGWRGRHGLIVTPEFGPALRLATLYGTVSIDMPEREINDCGDCRACLEICPVLRKGMVKEDLNTYREMCRRHIRTLDLDDEVCGICVRRCWEVVTATQGE